MAGDVLYGRRCRLRFVVPSSKAGDFSGLTSEELEITGGDDVKEPGMRIQFKINKTSEKDPNTSEIIVSNLNPDSRAWLQKKGVKVTVEAGYVATGLTRIFYGDARSTDHVRNGADWDTTIKLGDGERSYRNARANESFSPGTGAGDILKFLGNASGLALGNLPDEVANLSLVFDQGYVVSGLVSKSLDKLVKAIGYTWSVQDGALQILRRNTSLQAEIPEISPESGLIGSPEMGSPEKKGKPALVKFKCLLTPVVPSGRVKLVSERYNGNVRIKKCSFDGDTHGGNWYTNIEGVIDAST